MTGQTSARLAATVIKPALTQVAATLVLAGLALVMLGGSAAWSVLLGGVISTIPSAYFAYKVMGQSGARAMARVVSNAYLGEVVKLALIGAGFALVFVLVEPLHVPGLFAGFVLVHLAGLAAVIRYTRLG